jgi:N-sulfoglucosamine sulfohydrolase
VLVLIGIASAQTTRPNVLLITADDMAFDTPGYAGGKAAGITPNLDALAGQGIYFKLAHVTVAVCQPSRSVLMTGRYPHRNGAEGFNPIRADVPTLGEQLRAAGYYNGIFAKVPHLAPIPRFCWDTIVQADDLGIGRDPNLYYQHAKEFFEAAKKQGKPFFLMANSQDPHRPFAGSAAEKLQNGGDTDEGGAPLRPRRAARAAQQQGKFPGVSRTYGPGEITVPPFLPDLPDVRKELAQYYTSAHRCDETVGAVLRALKETGFEENTLVMFLSDNGISEPPAKSNCYLFSTRTPWVVRWPGKIKAGQVDEKHLISGIDFLPTVLEAAGLPAVEGIDGRSFLPLATGQQDQPGREQVVTVYHETVAKRRYEMRCVQDARFGYIYNGWSDGKTVYQSEPMGGLAFRAMKQAAGTDADVAARVRMIQYRVPEELYDLTADPGALHNLVDDAKHAERLRSMRAALLRWMETTKDPQLDAFRKSIKGPA